MFNIGIGELLFIAVLALLVLGPERLPKVMRQLGEYAAMLRGVVNNFNSEFAEELKPLNELRSLAQDLNPMRQLGTAIDATQPGQTIAPPQAPASPAPAATTSVADRRMTGGNPMAQLRGAMTAEMPGSTQAPASTPAAPSAFATVDAAPEANSAAPEA